MLGVLRAASTSGSLLAIAMRFQSVHKNAEFLYLHDAHGRNAKAQGSSASSSSSASTSAPAMWRKFKKANPLVSGDVTSFSRYFTQRSFAQILFLSWCLEAETWGSIPSDKWHLALFYPWLPTKSNQEPPTIIIYYILYNLNIFRRNCPSSSSSACHENVDCEPWGLGANLLASTSTGGSSTGSSCDCCASCSSSW